MQYLKIASAAFAAALLSACAVFGAREIPPGTPKDQVIAKAGRPTRIVPLPGGGERLQYSLQPAGQQAWMVDLDASGRAVRVYQALTDPNFNRIQVGWTAADIEREFGPPGKIDRVSSFRGVVWEYRWQDVMGGNMFYWVYVDPNGIVQRAHPGMEWINAPDFTRR
ncbi:hypothetical protein [Ramlibacter sp. PS4R-6]|uniref:hypothetical protein n=1 Tax=Ramlibacter sp. PS4R-6 TaxID=3133438 RepID=UPI00309D90D8